MYYYNNKDLLINKLSSIKSTINFLANKGLIKSVRLNSCYAELKVTPDSVYNLLQVLRSHLLTKFDCLIDITAYNCINNNNKSLNSNFYSVVYNILSISFNNRIVIYSEIPKGFFLKSICLLFKNSNWMEREVFDMFGIVFYQHPDLRKILSDYGFSGNPLDKDFPLKGFYETYYSDGLGRLYFKRVVDVVNNFRLSFIKNPWIV